MSQDLWSRVDAYLVDTLFPPDPVLDAVLAACDEAHLPDIAVSPPQGRMLQLFARMIGAKKILEIGTLGGYSGIWLARALADGGRLVTLEADPHHATVARANFDRAGIADRVEVRVGPAVETLPGIEAEGLGPFDFVFIDADKPSNPDYLAWALRLSRPGTLIVCDNVIRGGAVADPASSDSRVQGVRRFFELAAADARLTITAVQTVGSKGYDGFALLRVSG